MEKIKPESLFELKSLAQAKKAGNRIFFVETRVRKEENDYETVLKSVDLDTYNITDWGDDGSVNTALEVSLDQKYVSYLSNGNKDKKLQLRAFALSGGKPKALTDEKNGVSQYLWGQDSETLYYVTAQDKEEEGEKKDEDKFPQPHVIDKVTYKLDGAGLLPSDKTYVLKKVNVKTGEIKAIHAFSQGFSLDYISQLGTYALISISNNQFDEWDYGKGKTYRFDFETQQLEVLPIDLATFHVVAVTPDQRHYLVTGNDFSKNFVTQDQLYAYEVTTGHLTHLSQDLVGEPFDLFVADFQQQSYGADIVFTGEETFMLPVTEKGSTVLYHLNLEGQLLEKVEDKHHLTSLSYVSEGLLAVTYSTTSTPSGLALLDWKAPFKTDLYWPNEDFLDQHAIVVPERFSFKGYEDWDIDAWYLKPTQGAAKYPLILNIHGGPQVAFGETFFHEMQTLAAHGYAVLMVNPRGGNGYGQDFVASILGDYGNHDFDDLMMGLDAVLERDPQIDRDRLYVTGGSYGGFMTNWIVTHTDRFKAAVTQRSISNWISFYGVSDIGPFFVKYQLLNDFNNLQRLWEMSPLAHVKQAKTPLLILHGEADLRCPLEQAQQFYIGLKENGVETRLMTFPRSSHGLSRSGLPNLRMARLHAMMDWFDQHQ